DPTATAPSTTPVDSGPAAAGDSGTTTSTPGSNPLPADPGASEGGSSGLRIGSYAAFGVGAVGIGLGVVFALQSSSKDSEADDICNLPGGNCPESRRDEVNQLDADARSARTLDIIGFAIGGVGIGAGVTLLVLSSGSSKSAQSAAGVVPWVGLNS